MSSWIPGSRNTHPTNNQWLARRLNEEEAMGPLLDRSATLASLDERHGNLDNPMPGSSSAMTDEVNTPGARAANSAVDREREPLVSEARFFRPIREEATTDLISPPEPEHQLASPSAPTEPLEGQSATCAASAEALDEDEDDAWDLSCEEGIIIGNPYRDYRTPETLLEIACSNGDLDLVYEILEHHPKALEIEDNWSLFMFAAGNGQTLTCDFLYEELGSEIITVEAFKEAAKGGHTEICKLCLDFAEIQPDDVNNGDLEDVPLFAAVQGGHYETAKLLLEKGAKILYLQIALQMAIRDSQTNFAKNLLLFCKENLSSKQLDTVLNDDHSEVDDCVGPPLACAARLGNRELCKLLVECGANIEQHGEPSSYTPFSEAIFGLGPNHPICKDLLDLGADVDAKENGGGWPSMIQAVMRGDTKLCEKLFAWGANIDAKDEEGRTALMYAANLGNSDLCLWLLCKGARIDAIDDEGMTALMHTTSKLLEVHWDAPTPDLNYGNTRAKRVETAALLLEILAEV